MLFRIPVLGGLQDHILVILELFWGPFGDHFGHFWGTVFALIFGGFPGLAGISSRAGGGGDLRGIWGPVTGLNQQDKQIYRWKSADL